MQGEEIVIEHSPDDVRIVVQGFQDSEQPATKSYASKTPAVLAGIVTAFEEVVTGMAISPPGAPSGNGGVAWYNVAAGNFDLSGYNLGPGDRVSIPFTLTSEPLNLKRGKLGGYLAFEITGRIEVTRH